MIDNNSTKNIEMSNDCFSNFPELESERLIFRKITKADVEEIFKIYSDPEVAKYDFFRPIKDKEKAFAIIERYNNGFLEEEEITWGIAKKSDNKIIGYCCIGDFDEDAARGEIGYGFNRDEWNKGYGTEAIKTMVEFCFSVIKLNRIEATVTYGNDPSVRVLKKAGFIEEGILRERTMIKGELVDDVMLAILRKDYTK
jgi:ribosomal-protein-alanine N-acetyltransferase